MGQAKVRGSKEQRVKEGEAKREMTKKIRAETYRAYLASLTPEEKAKMKKYELMLSTMAAVAVSVNL